MNYMRDSQMRDLGKFFKEIAITMLVVSAMFFLLIIIAFCIPEKYLVENVKESYVILKQEELWEEHFTYVRGAWLDNATDDVMLGKVLSEAGDRSVIYRAMDCNGYARYWHGYLIFLKPLLLIFSYSQIRYLYMFLHLLSFSVIIMQLDRRFDRKTAMGWAVSLGLVYFNILPFSLQFSSVFFIMYAALMILDKRYSVYDLRKACKFFLVIGMVTSYFDLLTAPLITLGIPLIYMMLLNQKECGGQSFDKNMRLIFCASFMYGGGYFGNWFIKWILASFVLKRNVILDGLTEGTHRIAQDSGRLNAIGFNIYSILPPGITRENLLGFLLVIACLFVLLAVFLARFHAERSILLTQIPFVIVMLYPYIWYSIFSNHSNIHHFFTYRSQMITVWAGWNVFIHSINIKPRINDH